eukprot:CAMPEP_0118644324 /NCGR_PEP_ID=MMETSP0785-20121206/6884_1 /TAXON_ID=91992 /ORGANISM="Bolidomonas pacifica, Strain CCMP 1866" /LENGTH=60 /DNA_ID=CAMNT_0006536087 /DNA_START=618 /DNA_END=797 /DNA_ORIENTATION=+
MSLLAIFLLVAIPTKFLPLAPSPLALALILYARVSTLLSLSLLFPNKFGLLADALMGLLP